MINGRVTEAETLLMWVAYVRRYETPKQREWYIKQCVSRSMEKRVRAVCKLEDLI